MREGRASGGVAVMAASYGMDPTLPKPLLYRALEVRYRRDMDTMRMDALTRIRVAAYGAGAKMDYWDICGHLYPPDYVEERKRAASDRTALAQEQALIDRLESMRGADG